MRGSSPLSRAPAVSSDPRHEAIGVFARWVERQASTEGEGFEALLVANPDLVDELRALRADWDRVQALLDELGLTRSLGERLRQRYGSGADPGISLGGDGKADKPGDFTSDVFRRLAGRRGEIGRYRLRGEIASGGQGAILRVWDEDLRRHLAMKVLLGQADVAKRGDTPPVDSRSLGRFLEEAQVTAQLDHPGIVPVHELGLDSSGRVYFTMKLVQGRNLKEVLKLAEEEREGWTRTRVLSVLLKVCEAMAYAHHKGVVHRDLKPANVMVGRFGEVFVMDWGLAKVLGRAETKDVRIAPLPTTATLQSERQEADSGPDSPLLTMDGDVVGTPAYMAPEQAQGKGDAIGPHSDVYAVGSMLYQLLGRQMPYCVPGMRVSNRTVLAMLLMGPPAPLHTLQKDIPAELEAICEKAMARDLEKRYPDTSALAEDMRAFLENRVVHAYETGATAEARKWIRRNRGLATASAAAVLALIAGVVTSLTYASRAAEKGAVAQREARRADDEARAAEHSAAEAGRLRDEAIVREAAATERADALWAIEELKHFETLDDDLEYARSQDRPAAVWWLERAHELVDGRPGDASRGSGRKPGLEGHRRLLERIRSQALFPTAADLAADRAGHPRAKELERKRAELLWTSRMLGLEPWPSAEELEARLASEESPEDAAALNERAWELVDPDGRVFGREREAVALATRAVEAAAHEGIDMDAMDVDTLAWALLWAGRIDEALATERGIVEGAPPARKAEFEGYLRRMETAARPFRDGSAARKRESLAAEVAALEREVSVRRTFRFDDREKEWWNTHLAALVLDLEELQQRIVLAERSVSSPEAMARWKEAIDAIARSDAYGGLRLSPQLELLPLGPDPDSGLWEFAHLGTGEPPRRGSDGVLLLKPETGIVFVLLPAGRVPVEDGKRSKPINEVVLDAFFLSKYEMTVAQWTRTSRWTGRFNRDGPLLPADGVSWNDCVATLERAGPFLRLPTETQWEYGCRAETTTRWWTGATEDTLVGAASVDLDSRSQLGEPRPVGELAANPFGLHDVHGNVWEWCRDEFGEEDALVRPGDGEHPGSGKGFRVYRGGGYTNGGSARVGGVYAPTSMRLATYPEDRFGTLGVRVARSVTP